MDLLNLIINPEKLRNTCFLCYKCADTVISLYDKNEIHCDYFEYDITLWNIMKELYPTAEFLLSQACRECANLIIKTYLLLQQSQVKNKLLSSLVDNIDNNLNKFNNIKNTLKLNIDIPTLHTINEKQNSFEVQEKGFETEKQLQNTSKMKDENTNQAMICYVCGKIFNKPSLLKSHLSCHKKKQCPHCSKVFKSCSHFNVHLRNHKEPMKRVRNRKYYNCGNCSYKTINHMTLDAHINKIHLNIRPYVCEVCHKGFYKKSNLIEHMATHKSKKKQVCDVCGEGFVSDKTLTEHLRLHTGQKPFKCAICSATFVNSGRRYEHIIRMHKKRNETCEVCGKKFGFKKDLKVHLKSVHHL